MVLRLRDDSEVPIYQQLYDQIVAGISDGRLSPGERLSTVRALAAEIGVNAMTVNRAYQQLKQDGFLLIDRRSGARVREQFAGQPELPPERAALLRQLGVEARARGVSRAAFLAQCEAAYGEEGERK